ncbi:cytochrome P450 [Streptomyces sp. ICBB 8177]|uniref:cytochrome P450 n=1 Tax=Streptomyces sp. ICBB 8177 TaxID=563922 RepID=UPI0011B512E6|nr:cytochrome P450 [Streptomyces sp. ICBB 8177]
MDPETLLFSMFTPEGRENPHPALARLRAVAPVYRNETLDTYFLTRFDDCQAVLTDPGFRTPDLQWCEREMPDWREHAGAEFFYSSMLRANGDDHARVRRLVGGAFSARRVAALSGPVEETVSDLLDRFADATGDGGHADFQELVGYPLPVAVVGDLIGVPRPDQERFRGYGQDAGRLLEPVRTDEDFKRADHAVESLREYFAELLERRRCEPADDLATALLQVRDADDGRLTQRELVDNLLLVFVAGFETTTSLLGLTVHALLSHPDQLTLVRDDPALARDAVEESLRWDTPVRMTERIASRPARIGGVDVPEGANVTTVLAAANRDPARHPDPDPFLVRRPDVRVLSFSAGAHFCLGAALARMEGATAIRGLLTRFPGLYEAEPPVRRDSISLRAFDRLALAVR